MFFLLHSYHIYKETNVLSFGVIIDYQSIDKNFNFTNFVFLYSNLLLIK